MNIDKIIELSLAEDLGYGDITTTYLALPRKKSTAFLIAKAEGVIAGIDVCLSTFRKLDPQVMTVVYRKDGDRVVKGDTIAKIEGEVSALLQAERTALNFVQRMSGIATLTSKYVEAVAGLNAKILDTRKTTPLLRQLEKYAVRVGGGFNHRFGLYDMIMIKENHNRAAGSISKAVELVKKHNTSYKIEVEVTNLDELNEAYGSGVDRIMLDNMSLAMMTEAVNRYSGKVELEASGNVTLDTVRSIAETGVDYISSGSLTHSYKSLDISLLFKE